MFMKIKSPEDVIMGPCWESKWAELGGQPREPCRLGWGSLSLSENSGPAEEPPRGPGKLVPGSSSDTDTSALEGSH